MVCAICGEPLRRPATGPAPTYCSARCRVRAYRRRRRERWASLDPEERGRVNRERVEEWAESHAWTE